MASAEKILVKVNVSTLVGIKVCANCNHVMHPNQKCNSLIPLIRLTMDISNG